MRSMRFRVAGFFYTLTIAEAPLLDRRGEVCLGLAEANGRRIRISSDVPKKERVTTLLHELRHCWGFHVPKVRTEEEECDLLAAIAESAYDDMRDQGGPGALHRLGDDEPPARATVITEERSVYDDGVRYIPADEVQRFDTLAHASGGRAECGHCCMTVSDGAIVTSRARFEDKAVGWVVTRSMYCPHCTHLQIWDEGADPNGLPNGSPLAPPRYERGRPVEDFLRANPRAAGMAVG